MQYRSGSTCLWHHEKCISALAEELTYASPQFHPMKRSSTKISQLHPLRFPAVNFQGEYICIYIYIYYIYERILSQPSATWTQQPQAVDPADCPTGPDWHVTHGKLVEIHWTIHKYTANIPQVFQSYPMISNKSPRNCCFVLWPPQFSWPRKWSKCG